MGRWYGGRVYKSGERDQGPFSAAGENQRRGGRNKLLAALVDWLSCHRQGDTSATGQDSEKTSVPSVPCLLIYFKHQICRKYRSSTGQI